jgi:Flp pilus assembly CpaE family ATPase
MKLQFLGALPFDPAVVEGGDRGHLVLEDESDTPFKQALREFADSVLKRLRVAKPVETPEGQTVH